MHNCRDIRERFTDLLLDGVDCRSDEAISLDLSRCAECRTEFESLSATLRMANRAGEMAIPSEAYWPVYHSKLRHRLADTQNESTTSRAKAQRRKEKLGPLFEPLRPRAGTNLLTRFLKTSVPVPLPLAIALIITAALLLPFVIRAARIANGSNRAAATTRAIASGNGTSTAVLRSFTNKFVPAPGRKGSKRGPSFSLCFCACAREVVCSLSNLCRSFE